MIGIALQQEVCIGMNQLSRRQVLERGRLFPSRIVIGAACMGAVDEFCFQPA